MTAWELGQHGIAHTVIVDNAGGHLMREGLVDLCIVGTDRTTRTGDVCNKIGTYLKAVAAHDTAGDTPDRLERRSFARVQRVLEAVLARR